MKPTTLLELGRVSNLPTVWSNALAAASLAGASLVDLRVAAIFVAMSLAYVGGMYLNDAFDREIDARERPERPIPSGRIRAELVFRLGYGMLFIAVLLVVVTSGSRFAAVVAAVALAAAIVLYNIWHKENPSSPLLMGICRSLVYLTTGLALLPHPSSMVYVGAGILLCYLIGLTYTAKQERFGHVRNLWPLLLLTAPLLYAVSVAHSKPLVLLPSLFLVVILSVALRGLLRRSAGDIPRAIVLMITGISLVDAMFLAATAGPWPMFFAIACGVLTLCLQRVVPGT